MAKLGGVEVKVRESLLQQDGGKVAYDRQTTEPVDQAFAGELRGFYKPGKPWRPRSSTFNGRTADGGRTYDRHKGVDIYAPYFEYPLETPVFALCSGRLQTFSWTLGQGDLGHFVSLIPSGADGRLLREHQFLYGHFNRFSGRSRNVQLGQMIGYAGCTGNADEAEECSKVGDLNINSGHVHLKYERPTKPGAKADDPLPVLGWKLRFDPNRGGPLAGELADLGPYKLEDPPRRQHATGWLVARTQEPQRRSKKDSATPVDLPCDLIDIDRRASIDMTCRAYEIAQTRLSTPQPKSKAKDIWKGSMDQLAGLHTRLAQRVKAVDLAPGEEQQPQPAEEKSAAVLHFLLEAHRALWLALAGRAVLELLRKQTDPKTAAVPDSGIGSNGVTWAIAVGQGQSALHMTRLQKADGTLRSWTASVTFGAGTEWHAVLDSSLREGLADQPEALKFLDGLEFLVLRLLRLHKFAAMNHRLINQGEPGSIRVLTSFMRIVAEAVDVLAKASLPDEAWERFARALFAAAEQACESALLSFNPAHKATVRRTPLVSVLALTNDKAAGGVEPDIPSGG